MPRVEKHRKHLARMEAVLGESDAGLQQRKESFRRLRKFANATLVSNFARRAAVHAV